MDEKIKLMSSVREEDKSSVYKKLMEHLGTWSNIQLHSFKGLIFFLIFESKNVSKFIQLSGLRGHLQDELLRIQQMLAADDPELRVNLIFIKIIVIKRIKNVNVCRPCMFCRDKNFSLF